MPTDGPLRVAASPTSPWFDDLAPGEPRYWTVTAWLDGASRSSLTLRLQGSGDLVIAARHGLRISVHRCTRDYPGTADEVRPACPGRETVVVPDQPLRLVSSPTTSATARTWRLPDLVGHQRERLLVTLGLPAAGARDRSLMGATAAFGVGLHASGDTDREDPGPVVPETSWWPLPDTGGPALGLTLLGTGLLVAGTLLVRRRRPARG